MLPKAARPFGTMNYKMGKLKENMFEFSNLVIFIVAKEGCRTNIFTCSKDLAAHVARTECTNPCNNSVIVDLRGEPMNMIENSNNLKKYIIKNLLYFFWKNLLTLKYKHVKITFVAENSGRKL